MKAFGPAQTVEVFVIDVVFRITFLMNPSMNSLMD